MVDKVHTYGERDLALKINEIIDALDALTGAEPAPVAAEDVTATAISPGTATDVQGILEELAARITNLEP